MPYVERRDGKIISLYANAQSGYAEEFLADDHPEIVALRNPPPSNEDVNTERDQRTHKGFMFNGKLYQFDPDSKARVTGAATLAKFAILKGKQAGDLRWMNPNADFSWIAADNSLNTMDAQTASAFGDAAATHEQRHIFAARAIKAMNPIPEDYKDDKYWPALA